MGIIFRIMNFQTQSPKLKFDNYERDYVSFLMKKRMTMRISITPSSI